MLKYTKLNLPQHSMLTSSNHSCAMFSLSEFECLMVDSSWGHGRDYTVTVDPLYLGTAATQLLCWDYQQAGLAASFFRMHNEQKELLESGGGGSHTPDQSAVAVVLSINRGKDLSGLVCMV